LAPLLAIVAFGGGPPKRVWEVRLSEKLIEPAGWTRVKGHPIMALAFSPDGGKIAATMDDHYQAGLWRTHLLIVDVQNPLAAPRQFDLETCGNDLAWSPRGDALLVCGRILRLDDGSSCDLGPVRNRAYHGVLASRSFWLNADRVILFNRTIADPSCRSVDKWTIPGDWYVEDTMPQEGWMLLRESVRRTASNGRVFSFPDYAVADRDSRQLTSSLLVQAAAWSGSTMMAPGGRSSMLIIGPGGPLGASLLENPRR